MKREDVVEYLAALTESEAAALIHESMLAKTDDLKFEGGDFEHLDIFCLARCSFGSFRGTQDDKAVVELYAPPEGNAIGPGLKEQGTCSNCKVELISGSKEARCPICGTIVELT